MKDEAGHGKLHGTTRSYRVATRQYCRHVQRKAAEAN